MEHNKIADRLNNINHGELGIPFDEGFLWERLSEKIAPSETQVSAKWIVAAVMFFLTLFLPLSLRKGVKVYEVEVTASSTENSIVDPEVISTPPANPSQKSLVLAVAPKPATLIPIGAPHVDLRSVEKLETIDLPGLEEMKVQYALEDISVIQSSLQKATVNNQRIEKRRMSVRAQLQTSTLLEGGSLDQSINVRLLDGSQKRKN